MDSTAGQSSNSCSIDREMGQRSGFAGYIIAAIILLLFLFYPASRNILPLGLLPVLLVIAGTIVRPLMASRLASSSIEEIKHYRHRYLWSTFSIIAGWSSFLSLLILEYGISQVTYTILVASAITTVAGMGTLAQYRTIWRAFQTMLWLPVCISLLSASIGHGSEAYVFSFFTIAFAIISTRTGDRVCNEYQKLQAQADALSLAKEKIEEQAREVEQHRDYLKELVDTQNVELAYAVDEIEAANATQNMFLANMSHELRTPMHAILSFSQFGIKRIEKQELEKLGEYFERIHTNGERLMTLLTDLLDLAKLESGQSLPEFQNANLLDTIQHSISKLSMQSEGHSIEVKVLPETCDTYGQYDTKQIQNVVGQLLSNALHFTGANQGVEVEISCGSAEESHLEKDFLQVSIIDHGIGLPENEEKRVFEKFTLSSKTDTGAGGTGLGLAICKEIMRLHRGRIWAENNPDGGARFTFQIPRDATLER